MSSQRAHNDDSGGDGATTTMDTTAPAKHLTISLANSLAAQWYATKGPYAGSLQLIPIKTVQDSPLEFSIRFKVSPPTGSTYARRFHFATIPPSNLSSSSGYEVVHWTDDASLADSDDEEEDDDGEYDDDEYDEDPEEECRLLQEEGELSIEELRARYSQPPPEHDDDDDDDGDDGNATEDDDKGEGDDDDGGDDGEGETRASIRHDDSSVAGSVLADVTPELAMNLAKNWYTQYGPYRFSHEMVPRKAYKNSNRQWSIKFKVQPDTGLLYTRRFHFAVGDGQAYVSHWTDDASLPASADYDPNDDMDLGHHVDVEETMAEDEAENADEHHKQEIADLQADNALSIEELMAKYYGNPQNSDSDDDNSDDHQHDEHDDTVVSETKNSPKENREGKRHVDEREEICRDDITEQSTDAIVTKRAKVEDERSGDEERQPSKAANDADEKVEEADEAEEDSDWCSDTDETDAFTKYMKKAAEETFDDVDEYTPHVKVEPKIGDQYQCVVPLWEGETQAAEDIRMMQFATLLWQPVVDEELLHRVSVYLSSYSGDDHRLETAHGVLFAREFNIPQAQQAMLQEFRQKEEWSAEEELRFSELLKVEKKKFHNIVAILNAEHPHQTPRTTRDVVQHYWESKKKRQRHIFHKPMTLQEQLFGDGDLDDEDDNEDDEKTDGGDKPQGPLHIVSSDDESDHEGDGHYELRSTTGHHDTEWHLPEDHDNNNNNSNDNDNKSKNNSGSEGDGVHEHLTDALRSHGDNRRGSSNAINAHGIFDKDDLSLNIAAHDNQVDP